VDYVGLFHSIQIRAFMGVNVSFGLPFVVQVLALLESFGCQGFF
jgi:hypothetical protein